MPFSTTLKYKTMCTSSATLIYCSPAYQFKPLCFSRLSYRYAGNILPSTYVKHRNAPPWCWQLTMCVSDDETRPVIHQSDVWMIASYHADLWWPVTYYDTNHDQPDNNEMSGEEERGLRVDIDTQISTGPEGLLMKNNGIGCIVSYITWFRDPPSLPAWFVITRLVYVFSHFTISPPGCVSWVCKPTYLATVSSLKSVLPTNAIMP